MGGSRGTSFLHHSVKSIVNSPESTGMGFWSINPYVGCVFGCTYCYARFAHRYVMERVHQANHITDDEKWRSFEQQIFVKQRRAVITALERDLTRMYSKAEREDAHPVIIGTATDPYQPAERRFEITRVILERLLEARGLTLGIFTKSPLVCRDSDLLSKLGRRHTVAVYISLISTNGRVIKLFEARSPAPHARLRTVSKLRDAGINVGINAAPVLPGITDSAFHIDALVAAARHANAAFVHPSPLRLYPATRGSFLPIVAEHFPDLTPRYRATYRGGWDAPTGYIETLEHRFQRIAHKHGITAADPFPARQEPQRKREVQLSLL